MQGEMPADFVRAMVGGAEVLGQEMSTARVRGYWSILGHYGAERIVAAIVRHLSTPGGGPFFPEPSRLIEIMEGGCSATEAEATATWVSVLSAVRGGGGDVSQMKAADPRVATAIAAAGGEFNMRTGADGESENWRQRRFVLGFMGAAELRRRAVTEPLLVRGIVEHLKLEGGVAGLLPASDGGGKVKKGTPRG